MPEKSLPVNDKKLYVDDLKEEVTFESIDLLTVMQIIHLDKKTTAIQIDLEDRNGMIYFVDGEIIHAEYDGLEGEPAVLKLIALNRGVISIKAFKGRIKRTMDIPFVQQMMKIMKTIDEMQTNKNQQKREYAEEKDKEKEFEAEREELKKVLKPLTQINGYWGAGVFTPYGKLLEKKPGGPEIPIEDIGSMFYHPLNEARKMTKNLELGNLDIIQLHTDTNIIFVACHTDEKLCFFTILVIKSDGNVAMAKIQLKKTVETLKSILS